jgi:tetratricopeptide (TPR) repeat protein
MDIQYEENKQDISKLSKQFGIVTRNTSLIVLEELDDYLRYDIVPPAELSVAYEAALKVRRKTLLEQKTNLMNAAVTMAKDLKTWWETDFNDKESLKERDQYPVPERMAEDIVSTSRAAETVRRETENRQAARSRRAAPTVERLQDAKQEVALNDIVVVGYANQAKNNLTASAVTLNNALSGRLAGGVVNSKVHIDTRPQPKIVVHKFKSYKAYMKLLVGTPDSAYASYLKLRSDYISTPMFYFDVANWFYEQKDSVRALTILSNIADLDLENADLYKTLAYKLKQTKNYKEEIFVTQKVLQWRPMDAQSYRDYALALADDGQYQKALDNLYSVLTKDYNAQISDRDQGIEEIIISEINNLIAKHGKELVTRHIDKRLIQSLPVDVRVVLNWNKNDTDIDLWLTDPTGERGYYGNPKTKIGGRISDDFTSGYGPEQFMIKKAIKGKYKIEVNYFDDQQINISGPTTVTAEIYTRYATGKQQREVIVLPMSASDKKGNLVGEFYF